MASLEDLESTLLDEGDRGEPLAGPVFIVGAPRTGSTILFQALIAAFHLPYIANLTNTHFAETPIIGLSIQAAWPVFGQISGQSRFGKVDGMLQPSEASAVMKYWFGGGHPSELVSNTVLPGRERHMKATIAATWRLFERPLVIKNAWNCFRITYLAATLPSAAFIWIRRDIAASAVSDLHARYVIQGTPEAWNSATPRNWEELRQRPYWEQVVENQAEFSRAIGEAVSGLPPSRFAMVWYEDFVARPAAILDDLATRLPVLRQRQKGDLPPVVASPERGAELSERDVGRIERYLAAQRSRLAPLRHPRQLAEA